MPTKARSRSRSRSISRSRRTSRNVAKVLREPSPEDAKIIDDSKIEIETRINENGNEAVKVSHKYVFTVSVKYEIFFVSTFVF